MVYMLLEITPLLIETTEPRSRLPSTRAMFLALYIHRGSLVLESFRHGFSAPFAVISYRDL